MKKILLVCGVICLILFSCNKAPKEDFIPMDSVSVSQPSIELKEGEAHQLEAIISPSNATYSNVSWSSSKPSVAKVSETGLVSAVSAGTATVTASAGGKKATCSVTVVKAAVVVEVVSVSIDRSELDLNKGESALLTAEVKPDDATVTTVRWSSSDSAVASVSEDGTVTAVGAGSATITAECNGKTDECVVTVSVPVERIVIGNGKLLMEIEDELFLEATVFPEDATDSAIVWSSSDPQVADVDEDGCVVALSEGSAMITATAGGKSATVLAIVSQKVIHVTSITLVKTSLSLEVGVSGQLTATVLPEDATDISVIWASTNNAIAEVNETGLVTAKSVGSVTVTATTVDGGLIAACEVTTFAAYVEVTSISLDKTTLELLTGQSETLIATVLPKNATDRKVVWDSSDEAVASVDQQGTVTAIGAGSAIITATADEFTAECTVAVTEPEIPVIPVERVTLDKTTLTLDPGQSADLVATVYPSDADYDGIKWISGNSEVATVNNGKVLAIGAGTTTITARAGSMSAVCTVTVNKPYIPVSSITLSSNSLSMTVGEYQTISATVMPENATDRKITWRTSDSSIAAVDDFGTVIAAGAGIASITATAGEITATCVVTVSEPEVPPVDPPTPPDPPQPDDHPFTSNVTWTLGNKAYDHTSEGDYQPQAAVINGITVDKIVKLGTSSANGDFTVNIPAGTTYIGFFALGWKGSSPTLTLTGGGSSKSYDIKANTGVSNTPPYTISTTEDDAYFTYDVTSTTATTVKFESNGRVVVWGINAYNGENPNPGGGDTPGGGDDPGGGDTPGGGDDPGGSTTYAGWMELPATNDSNLYFVSHTSSVNGSGRNYSYYWDATALVARWVAYPLNSDIIGTGTRTDKWAEDTALPNDVPQPILKKAFNPSSYSRGHQIASADRLRYADNVQTFYYTNMTPQESGFNGGVWNSLEQKVRSWSSKFDTLYVVTGCVVEGSTQYALDNSGKRVKVPVGYYKALLGYDKSKQNGISSQTDGYTGIAFYFDHFGSYSSSAYMNQSMTIDALETKVGVDFFVNLPAAIGDAKASKVESTKDSWWK